MGMVWFQGWGVVSVKRTSGGEARESQVWVCPGSCSEPGSAYSPEGFAGLAYYANFYCHLDIANFNCHYVVHEWRMASLEHKSNGQLNR
jgi:hypothetical protein